MKKTLVLLISFSLIFSAFAQKEVFDIVTFSAPKGWKKEKTENAVQFTKEDATTGAYCAISLFKSMPATNIPKENFDLAWTSVVKEMVPVSTQPEMQEPETENGWQTLNGYAPFDQEGNKGVVILVTATSLNKMVNMIILTNTDVYEMDMTAFIESISLKKLSVNNDNSPTKTVEQTSTNQQPLKNGGFTFTTTNFDDGWTSIVQEDWVEVTKGNTKVLIHYPNKDANKYNSVLLDGLKNAWNVLLALRYSSASNMQFRPLSGWQSIEFAEADMVEKVTGKKVYVVLFKMNYSNGSGKYLEFISTSKAAFEQEFGAYHETTYGWEKMEQMANYNKFAVGATDLTGKWTNDFTGMTQYVNAYTGADAGANTHASNESFEFGAGNTYKWDLGVASGFVGNIKFQSAKGAGKFTMLNHWQVKFSDIEGKPKTYNVQFVCIKGARVLWIGETAFGKKE